MTSAPKRRPDRIAVYFSTEITAREIEIALREAGLVLRSEAGHRLVVDRVPESLRKPDPANVVRIPTRIRKAGR